MYIDSEQLKRHIQAGIDASKDANRKCPDYYTGYRNGLLAVISFIEDREEQEQDSVNSLIN